MLILIGIIKRRKPPAVFPGLQQHTRCFWIRDDADVDFAIAHPARKVGAEEHADIIREDGLSQHTDAQRLPNRAVSAVRADKILNAYLLHPTAGTVNEGRKHVVLALLKRRDLSVEADLRMLIS